MSCDTAGTSVTITGVTAEDTGIAVFAFRTDPVRDVATGIKLFVLIFFLICITAPVDVVALPWNEKVVAGRVEEEEVEVEVVLKPKPTVVTPSFMSVEEDGTLLEEEVEELEDDDEELSSLSSV